MITAIGSDCTAEVLGPHSLDWSLIAGRRHLERVLREYVDHYNGTRPHQALGLVAPLARGQPTQGTGEVVRRDLLGGLVHEYERRAA